MTEKDEIRKLAHEFIESCFVKDWIYNGTDEMPVTYFNKERAEENLMKLMEAMIDLAARNP